MREHNIKATDSLSKLRLAVPHALSKTGELTVRLQTGKLLKGMQSSYHLLQVWAKRIHVAGIKADRVVCLQAIADANPAAF